MSGKTGTVVSGESGLGPFGQIIVAERHVLTADQPEALGGKDTGPTPFQILAAALASCTAQTIRMYVQRKGWPLARVSVTVIFREEHPKHSFEVAIALEGALDDEQRARILEIAGRCPVNRALSEGANVSKRLA